MTTRGVSPRIVKCGGRQHPSQVLVICPASLKSQWSAEIARFSSRVQLLVTDASGTTRMSSCSSTQRAPSEAGCLLQVLISPGDSDDKKIVDRLRRRSCGLITGSASTRARCSFVFLTPASRTLATHRTRGNAGLPCSSLDAPTGGSPACRSSPCCSRGRAQGQARRATGGSVAVQRSVESTGHLSPLLSGPLVEYPPSSGFDVAPMAMPRNLSKPERIVPCSEHACPTSSASHSS